MWPVAVLPATLAVVSMPSAGLAPAVAVASPPAGVKVGWDAADALAEGWDEARATAFVGCPKILDSSAH